MGQRSAVRELTERSGNADATAKPPLHPLWVFLIAVLLPGVGQVVNNTPKRGLMFLFFIMSMGWVTLHLAPPEASFVGRYAGGFSFMPFRSWMPIGGRATAGRSFIATTGEPTMPRPDRTRHPSRPQPKNGGTAKGTARRTAIPPDMEAFA